MTLSQEMPAIPMKEILQKHFAADDVARKALEVLIAQEGDVEQAIAVLREHHHNWHEIEPNIYHASDAWKCLRQNYWKYTGTDNDKRPFPPGVGEQGKKAEKTIEEALSTHYGRRFVRNDIPVLIPIAEHPHTKVLLNAPLYVVGETDPVVLGWNGRFRFLYEVKSSEAGAKAKTKEWHRHQASIYAVPLAVEEVRIVHPARSDVLDMPEVDTIMLPMEFQALHEESIEYFIELHEAVTAKKLPPAVPKSDDDCDWCGRKDACIMAGGWRKVLVFGKVQFTRKGVEDK